MQSKRGLSECGKNRGLRLLVESVLHIRTMFLRGIQKSLGNVQFAVANSVRIASAPVNVLCWDTFVYVSKRAFSAETREYMDYILKTCPETELKRTKSEIIRDLNAPKLSNERVCPVATRDDVAKRAGCRIGQIESTLHESGNQ